MLRFGRSLTLALTIAAGMSGGSALAQADKPQRGGTLTASWSGLEPQALFVPAGGGSSPFFTATTVLGNRPVRTHLSG